MKTQVEIIAQKMLLAKTCQNCRFSKTGLRKEQPVLKCELSGIIVIPGMIGCFFWKRNDK